MSRRAAPQRSLTQAEFEALPKSRQIAYVMAGGGVMPPIGAPRGFGPPAETDCPSAAGELEQAS